MSNPAGENHRSPRRRAVSRRAPLGIESLESRILLASDLRPPIPTSAILGLLAKDPASDSVASTVDALADFQRAVVASGATAGTSEALAPGITTDKISALIAMAKKSLLGAASGISSLATADAPSQPAPGAADSPPIKAHTSVNWAVGDVQVNGLVDRLASLVSPAQPPPSDNPVQSLPDAEDVTLAGWLAPGNLAQIYRYVMRGDEAAIHIDVSIPQGADPTPLERLWLLDAAGDVIFHAPVPGPGGDLSVRVDAIRTSNLAPVVLVGISRDGSSPIVPADYSIRIVRSDVSSQGVAPSGSPATATVSSGSSRSSWTASPRQDRPTPTREGDSGTSTDVTTLGEQAAGLPADGTTSLPLRSAGPSAGVLADGHPIPPVGKGDGAVIDLTLIDLAAPNDPLDDGDEPEILAPIRSSGGLPLLGTACPPPRSEDASTALVAIATPAETSRPARTKSTDARRAAPGRRHPPIALGLGVAAAVAFGLLLPDFLARLTPDPEKRPLPWSRGKVNRRRGF